MNNQNISDLIESYLKQILSNNETIEIRRVEMANQFNCVPSQINYVIKTRFTIPKGYLVESKRGGGGYIRIMKINLTDQNAILRQLDEVVGDRLSQNDATAICQQLYNQDFLTKHEGNLVLSLLSKQVLTCDDVDENKLRAQLVHALIERLGYEEKE